MAELKTLACVGLNGFEQARVRLLLEEANTRLPVRWALGTPGYADLLLLVEDSPQARAASLAADGRGVHSVFLREGAEAGPDTLPTGFGVDELVQVLSSAFEHPSGVGAIDASMQALFDITPDTEGSDEVESFAAAIPDFGPPPSAAPVETVELEQSVPSDSPHGRFEYIVPVELTEAASIEPVSEGQPSARPAWRVGTGQPLTDAPAPAAATVQAASARDGRSSRTGPRGLEHFLDEHVLMAPCLLQVEGAEALVLDPVHRVYMIAGDLSSVDVYASGQFTDEDFDDLTSRELEAWRNQCPPQPYLRLQWLLALRRGEGWLPRHLDPGGTYRVSRMLDLDERFDPQIRIGEVLREWRRLHEVARFAGVDMQSVFHCVTAFDAIGWLESRPRERRF